MVEFTLDGRTVDRRRGRAARPRGRAPRHLHPDALPRRQARPVRRLPDVRRRRRGRAAAAAGLRDARRRGHGRLDERRRSRELPADADRDAPLRAPERVARADGRTSSSTSRTSSAPRRRSSSPTRSGAEYDDRNGLMGYDPDACILCNRCVRYTQEVMQCSALSLEGRGGHARIVPTWELSWLDTECELCGGCLSVCPTGAIYEKFEEGDVAARARARAGADDVHVLRRRLPDRPQPRPARRSRS